MLVAARRTARLGQSARDRRQWRACATAAARRRRTVAHYSSPHGGMPTPAMEPHRESLFPRERTVRSADDGEAAPETAPSGTPGENRGQVRSGQVRSVVARGQLRGQGGVVFENSQHRATGCDFDDRSEYWVAGLTICLHDGFQTVFNVILCQTFAVRGQISL